MTTLGRSGNVARTAVLVVVVALLLVPAATRAAQAIDSDGTSHQPSGFSHSGNLPVDPVSLPADTPAIVAVVATIDLPVVWFVRPADQPLVMPVAVREVGLLRAPPAA